MPLKRLPKKPKGTPSPRRVRLNALELVVREAAAAATKELQQLKDSQPKYPGTKTKIPASELTLKQINMSAVAAQFASRLSSLHCTVHALNIRLCKWRTSGHRDPVSERGRPRTVQLTPLKSLVIASAINASEAHLSAAQVGAISGNLTGGLDADKRQQRNQRRDLRASNNVIRGVSKATVPALLHATSSKTLKFKFYADMSAAYDACPSFESNPDSVVNFDEGNDPSRAGRDGKKTHGFTTLERMIKEGHAPVRTVIIPDGAGTASTAPWFAASGWLVAMTPIVQAPSGWDFGPEFVAPPQFTEPARHSGVKFLPGMAANFFTHGNTRVFCTESGVNNKQCFTRMFIDHVYPLWRVRVPAPAPLLLIYDSCKSHNWTPEISQFFADNNVHVMKLYHNTTTKSQALDCGVNLEARIKTAAIQDELMAAASFKLAYLGQNLKCMFRERKK